MIAVCDILYTLLTSTSIPQARMIVVAVSLPKRLNTLQVMFRTDFVSSSKSNSNIELFRWIISIGGLNNKLTLEFRNILAVIMLNCGGGDGLLATGHWIMTPFCGKVFVSSRQKSTPMV